MKRSLAITWRKKWPWQWSRKTKDKNISEDHRGKHTLSKWAKHYLHLGLDPGSNDIGLCTKLFTKSFILLLASMFFHQGLIPSGNQLPHLQQRVTKRAVYTYRGTHIVNVEIATRKGGVGVCTENKQSYGLGHGGKAHGTWILSGVGCTLQTHLGQWKTRRSFHSPLGFLVADVNWIAGPCSDLTLVILFGSKNHQHSWYGE